MDHGRTQLGNQNSALFQSKNFNNTSEEHNVSSPRSTSNKRLNREIKPLSKSMFAMEKNEKDRWVETNMILEETTSDIKIDDFD